MIDIHSHVLPGIDDGAATVKESVAMARIAAKDGIFAVVATPHAFDGVYDSRKVDILDGCRQLNELLVLNEIPVKIFPGQEVRLTPEILEHIDADRVLTLNRSEYILIELPMHVLPNCITDIIQSIRSRNLVPVIAHPERNPVLMTNMDLAKNLVYSGALFQITAGSFTGMFGRDVKKCAAHYSKMGMVHFVGSDAHSFKRRTPTMSKGLKVLGNLTGENIFRQYNELGLNATRF